MYEKHEASIQIRVKRLLYVDIGPYCAKIQIYKYLVLAWMKYKIQKKNILLAMQKHELMKA